jgi:hypothetical protein
MQRAADSAASNSVNHITALLAALNEAQALGDLGRRSESARILGEALNRAERLLVTQPQDPNLRYIQASLRLEQAQNCIAQDTPRDTVQAALVPALNELDRLAKEFSRTSSRQRRLAEALTAQAQFEHSGGSRDLAVSSAARAIEILEQLDREEGSPAVYQPLLGAAYTVAAEVDAAQSENAAAKAKLHAALRHLKRACEFNPDGPRLLDQIRRSEALLASLER